MSQELGNIWTMVQWLFFAFHNDCTFTSL